jgi:hypothetical protein
MRRNFIVDGVYFNARWVCDLLDKHARQFTLRPNASQSRKEANETHVPQNRAARE